MNEYRVKRRWGAGAGLMLAAALVLAGGAAAQEQDPAGDTASGMGAAARGAPGAAIANNPGSVPEDATGEVATIPVAEREEEDGSRARLDDVVVTAEFREQGVQDVVGSAQAFDGAALDRSGAAGMQDYLLTVPNVSLQPSGNGKMNIAMRGVSNVNALDLGFNSGSPTVGVYLNDVAIQGSGVFPDLRIYDLDRIEVLKGPQGTLYGEGSMGGAIKMITTPADYNAWSARAEGMVSTTADGSPSSELRGMVNVPIIDDQLGLRVVGTSRLDGGFVDYTSLGREDADNNRSKSARAILSWKPSEGYSFDYTYLYNSDDRDEFPVVDQGHEGDLSNTGPEGQFADTRFTINSLTGKFDLGFAQLTSVTSLFSTFRESNRRSPFLQSLIQTQWPSLGLPGSAPVIFGNAPSYFTTDLGSWSEELRLVSKGEHAIDWIAGAFYRARKQDFFLAMYENSLPDLAVLDALFGALNLQGFNLLSNLQEISMGYEQFRQSAVYGEATWHVVPEKLEVTAGLRGYREIFDYHNYTKYYGAQAVLIGGDPSSISADGVASRLDAQLPASGMLPKLSIGWHVTDGDLLYASISRGFRSAMPNNQAQLGAGPPTIRPDYVWNHEVGYKGVWLDGSLLTNLSAFHIDWQDIQGTLIGTATLAGLPVDFPYMGNAGRARIMGLEASTTWAPFVFMTLNASGGYTQALLTEPDGGSTVVANSQLPNAPRWTGSATAALMLPLFMDFNGEASLGYTYTGEQNTTFTLHAEDRFGRERVGTGNPVPAYSLLKASVGIANGRSRLQLFADNLTNEHAITAISAPIPQYTVIRPRVIGLRLSHDFP